MRRLLAVLAGSTGRRPITLLVALAVVTVVLGVFASQQQADADLTSFSPESDRFAAFERVQEEFAAGGSAVQVIVDAGEGGDVLSVEALRDLDALIGGLEADDATAAVLPPPSAAGVPPILSYATPLFAAMDQQGVDLDQLDDGALDELARQVYGSQQGAALAALLSQDRDLDQASARAGLLVVQLDPGLSEAAQVEASLQVRDVVDQVELAEVEASPFNQWILFSELESGMTDELPFLLGLSFLLIIGILAFVYRSVSDVLLGLVGLVVTIVWMYGIGVLLGPDYLGVAGYFSQISIVVPVLLVGLGIDYAIHLTSRYREERAADAAPDVASAAAVRSVGGALVLATITTMVGFLTNLITPLPPLRDFGMFAAAGVLAAFVVMGLLVPSARHVIDRRRLRRGRGRTLVGSSGGTGPAPLRRVMAQAALLTEHAPRVTMVVAVAITVAAGVAASQVSTEFAQEDFIPDDSYAGQTLAAVETLFGGDVTEQTYLLVEADPTDPALANALLDTHRNITADVDGQLIRGEGAGLEVASAPALVAQLASPPAPVDAPEAGAPPPEAAATETDGGPAGPDPAELAAALEAAGWAGDSFADDADMAALYELVDQVMPGRLDSLLADDAALITIGSVAGEDQAFELEAQLLDAAAPLEQAGASPIVVSEPLVFGEILDSLTDSQTRSIVITLLAALLLLVSYYGITQRRPLLGVVTMVPSTLSVAWVIGTMWLLGLSFNVLTSTVAALAIGIGVPYGIHITHRFVEDRSLVPGVDEAIRQTILHTGGALAGSAVTTAAGFGVLMFASLVPIQQFGGVTALTILYALVGAVLIQPSLLVLWDRHDRRRHGEPTDAPPATGPAGHGQPPAAAGTTQPPAAAHSDAPGRARTRRRR